MDIEDLKFGDGSFDGVWAYTSLLHVSKEKLSVVLSKISDVLKEDGIFYIGMKEGDFEGLIKSEKYGGAKRFFSLYKDEELKRLISEKFEILHASRVETGDAVFLNYLCRKKSS
jgi:SAM-dependent methyltransferase